MKLAASITVFLAALGGAFAQPLSNMVFTVGTTISDASSKNWSYVVVGSPQNQLLAGKQLAVYGKTSGTFTLRGTIFQQTDANAINNLLNQSVSLGDDLTSLGAALDALFPAGSGLALPQKVLAAFQAASANPSAGPELLILGRMHPGLNLCLGLGFAEVISATTTYEVREVNPASGVAAEVVGRVTIAPGAPIVLPAPGYPFQVESNAVSEDLRIRLRWGTPDALRRLSLLQFGFNVWRIPLGAALAGNFNVNPPTLNDLASNTNFTRVNSYPVIAMTDYAPLAGPGGPDNPADRSTFFFSDRNGRSPGIVHFPAGSTPFGYLTPAFNDGDQFYYFITARDILGRDGLASPGGLAQACRKMPPAAPTKLSVLNTTAGGAQSLLVRWAPDTNASDQVNEYWVYRWENPAMALTNDATPSNNVIGSAPQPPGSNLVSLIDSGPDTPGPSNYWYTVRAVSRNACGDLLFSPNSPPASGVLRDRTAPAPPTGELLGSCGSPVAIFQQFNLLASGGDTNLWTYRLTATRRDAGVAWVEFFLGDPDFDPTETFGPLYFPPDGNSVSVDVQIAPNDFEDFQAQCVAGTYYGMVSAAAPCETTNTPGTGQIIEAAFQAGELLLTALSSSDPFLQAANAGTSFCLPPINPARDASGTLHMLFPDAQGRPLLIQFSTNNGYVWTDLGVSTPDTNGVYSIYLCPCVASALPLLQGCVVNLPEAGDCDQHVARAGDSGPIAPIDVRFRLTPRTHEYRLYRTVDGGAPTLVAQAAALFDPSNPELVVIDDTMPPSASRLCYFVQTLDANGNGSPLALIGCKPVVPAKPPRPTLSQPLAIGDTSHPQVALSWFCPTNGVYRFEVRIHQDPPKPGSVASKFSSVALITLINPNPSARFFGLRSDMSLASLYDDWRLTPPIGPGFGPGPQFSLTADVEPNVTYHISVAAEDAHGNWGDASSEWTFTWKPPPTNLKVPWPARPLPPVTQFDDAWPLQQYWTRVAAVPLTYYDNTTQRTRIDPNYPVGIRFAEAVGAYYFFPNTGGTNYGTYYGAPDPNSFVFRRLSKTPDINGDPLLPMVVYREQVTNASFPRVSGNLTQVTPLLERIPWKDARGSEVFVADQLIALNQETLSDQVHKFLYLRDQQPVILGARYQYYAVRLNAQREVSEIIDAGTVDIPTNP